MARARRPISVDGAPNARIAGQTRHFRDVYHFFLTRSWLATFGILGALYLLANVGFACAYLSGGDCIDHARPGSFADAFFFSVQTMATIGYGWMAPKTVFANVVVTIEAVTGLIGFATATGLVFAKFSRPTARVLFSRRAIVAVRDGVPCFMFRMANERLTQIVEAHLHLVLVRDERTAEGEEVRRFYDLALARAQTAVFALSWTAIHPIGPTSPFHGWSRERLRAADAMVVASLVGFDEVFAQTVHARHTYTIDDIQFGARFVDVIGHDAAGRRVVDYTHFHDVVGGESGAVDGLARDPSSNP